MARMPANSDTPESEPDSLARARAGDAGAFERLVKPHRRRLHLHCYRMLGSPHDADDAVQEALLAAWRGLASFEGRSALGTWLYQIATRICLRFIAQRPQRLSSPDYAPALTRTDDLGQPVPGPVWIEPLPDEEALGDDPHEDPASALQRREHVALAFVAALQHLPGTQRAALLLRDVLEYSAAEAAELLDTSTAAVNSALQRAQKTLGDKLGGKLGDASQAAKLGPQGLEPLLASFMAAWESRNVAALVGLLTEDARFTMPPLPAWFDGRRAIEMFLAERMFATPWRLRPLRANGQPGFACYMQAPDGRFLLGAVNLLSLRDGRVAGIHGFLDPAVHERFGLPKEFV
jgi:RNA polymerase sigma-70 factor (TIGR02960 family)